MNITMQNTERLTLVRIREFVEGGRAIGFASPKGQDVYEFIERVLKSQQYRRINRGQKGVVRRFYGRRYLQASRVRVSEGFASSLRVEVAVSSVRSEAAVTRI